MRSLPAQGGRYVPSSGFVDPQIVPQRHSDSGLQPSRPDTLNQLLH
jgi:hypothetical protein